MYFGVKPMVIGIPDLQVTYGSAFTNITMVRVSTPREEAHLSLYIMSVIEIKKTQNLGNYNLNLGKAKLISGLG